MFSIDRWLEWFLTRTGLPQWLVKTFFGTPDWADSAAVRKWLTRLLSYGAILTKLTETKWDDEVVVQLQAVVANDLMWSTIYNIGVKKVVPIMTEPVPIINNGRFLDRVRERWRVARTSTDENRFSIAYDPDEGENVESIATIAIILSLIINGVQLAPYLRQLLERIREKRNAKHN